MSQVVPEFDAYREWKLLCFGALLAIMDPSDRHKVQRPDRDKKRDEAVRDLAEQHVIETEDLQCERIEKLDGIPLLCSAPIFHLQRGSEMRK